MFSEGKSAVRTMTIAKTSSQSIRRSWLVRGVVKEVNQAGVAQGSRDGVRVAGLGVYVRNVDDADLVT